MQRFNGDLVAACEGMVEEARAYHPENRILFETTGPLEGLFDQARMEQVFSNLIGNAVQHGTEGTPITVSLSAEEDMAVIAINNQGKPIEKEAIASIFNPMVRNLRETQYGSTAGLGLGLHIASAIVLAHKGTIEVHSKARVGTTFTVRIPLHPD